MRRYMIVGLGLLVAFAEARAGDGAATAPATQAAHVLRLAASADEFDPAFPVSPALELEDWVRAFETTATDEKRAVRLKEAEAHWLELKKNGKALWNSQEWMKEPDYYKKLDMQTLARECFARSVIFNELSKYNDPAFGLQCVRIMHNGFAELFSRADMRHGILAVLDRDSITIADPKSDMKQIVLAGCNIEAISTLCRLSPLREQVKGHEAEFLKAYIQVLKRFRASLESPRDDGAIGFFREPCSVANMSLVFLKQVASKEYEALVPRIKRVRFPQKQDTQDLRAYLDMVIASLEATHTTHQPRVADPTTAGTRPSSPSAALNLEDAAKRLTEATGLTWRLATRERTPGLGVELSAASGTWHGVAVPYFILPFGLDEGGKEKLELFRQNCNAALDIIASDRRCVVLAGPSRETDVTAQILAVLGLSESKQAEQSRIAHARAEWLDFRLAVAGPSGTKGDLPIPPMNGPTSLQITNYRELFDAKGPNGGRHRGDPFLWFWRLPFCELSPLLVTTDDKHKAQYVLLSNRPADILLNGSARPRPWHLKRVYATTDAQGRPAVGIEFDDTAAKLMGTLTEANIGRPLAILFSGNVLGVLTIEAKITDKLLISGGKFDKGVVDKIVRSLSECMLAENEIVRTVTRPATQPAFDRWGSLELAMREYNKGADPAEEAGLKRLEDALRENINNGWKPPWSDLELKLTEKEIASLSTAEICVKLFDGGLPARTLMLSASANAGIRRLEVLYTGYRDLFHREDCWKGLVASMDYYAAQLNVRAQGTAHVNAITGLMTVPKFYSYPPIRANIAGHQRELIAAHVRALKALKAYLDASASASGTDKAKPFFATMTPCVLVDWALVLGHDLSEQQYRSACTTLSQTKWDGRTTDSDLLAYIDEAVVVLEHFIRAPTTTQHESSQKTGDSIQDALPVTMPARD